jgi:Reverse transcriptase (RNA-dependent DNA polymerase)
MLSRWWTPDGPKHRECLLWCDITSLNSTNYFVGKLNKHALWGANVGNAYLEARTKEQLYIIGGPEFETLEGHTLLIENAFYGLRSSGLCWHQRFADVVRDLRFSPCKAEQDLAQSLQQQERLVIRSWLYI